jgi:hypothetical protein
VSRISPTLSIAVVWTVAIHDRAKAARAHRSRETIITDKVYLKDADGPRSFLRALASPHNRRCRRAYSPPPKPKSAVRVQAHAAGRHRSVRSRKACRRQDAGPSTASTPPGRTQNIVPPKKSSWNLSAGIPIRSAIFNVMGRLADHERSSG